MRLLIIVTLLAALGWALIVLLTAVNVWLIMGLGVA